jgi:hypothetical protein
MRTRSSAAESLTSPAVKTRRKTLLKFSFVLLVLLAYFTFVALEFGLTDGLLVTALTWSFFVLCTPVADAGFLLDFPLRLVTNIRMFVSEIFVWGIAIALNLYTYFLHPEIYLKTKLLVVFKNILEQPIPFWSIILVSAVGTFMSIEFGDELYDKVSHQKPTHFKKHKGKYRYVGIVILLVITLGLYTALLKQLGIDLTF